MSIGVFFSPESGRSLTEQYADLARTLASRPGAEIAVECNGFQKYILTDPAFDEVVQGREVYEVYTRGRIA